MRIFFNSAILEQLQGAYIFLDNDFLSNAFKYEELSAFLVDKLSDCYLMIDPLTEFEFRRNVYVPEQSVKKESFINQPIFSPVTDHQDIFIKIQQNALILSKIYTHNNQGSNSSFVDIHLAARLMYYSRPTYLITGNKRDFPLCVFNTVEVINVEQRDGQIQSFSIIAFDRGKFNDCYEKLKNLN